MKNIIFLLFLLLIPGCCTIPTDKGQNVNQREISNSDERLKQLGTDILNALQKSDYQSFAKNVNDNEKWDGPYIKPAVPKDPWGNDYNYVCPGEHGEYDLFSYGADGAEGGEGENADIINWVEAED